MPRIRVEPQKPPEGPQTATAVMEPPAPSPPSPAEQPPEKPVAVIQRRIQTAIVRVPLGEIGPGYRSRHIETYLTPDQTETMQRLVVALRDRRTTTANGREIRSAADAVRWLLEQIGA